MQNFLVGGAVRDELLGRHVKDRDWVVVGATPEQMLDMGFEQVGADFPVFLHPTTKEEYALARQERKVAPGYHGFETHFEPDVTLQDDLERRDLTINAMAKDPATGAIIDPFNGQEDLKNGVLRHVGPAFAEDPVRVLRVARFSARYGFTIHNETLNLMQELVEAGELDHLTPERVWAELEKALTEDYPARFFWTLADCGADEVLFPELIGAMTYVANALEQAVLLGAPMVQRFIILLSVCDATEVLYVCDRLKVSNEYKKSAIKFEHFVREIHEAVRIPREMVQLMHQLDLFRRPKHMKMIGQTMQYFNSNPNVTKFMKAFRAAHKVTFMNLTPDQQRTLSGPGIGEAIDQLRVEAIRNELRM